MPRILILGNSGSGKSTLARALAGQVGATALDLDTIAWEPDQPGVRRGLATSMALLQRFVATNQDWVIEGCYATLAAAAAADATEFIFLNPGVGACQDNCRRRPWESHKYASRSAQDKNLKMLLDWVADYETRSDEFSLGAHQAVFAAFEGPKREITSNAEAQARAHSNEVPS